MDKDEITPLRKHAADALDRARKLPIGPSRNDLRQLAIGLRWLEKEGLGSDLPGRLPAPNNKISLIP
jgi:hypothetical protein